MLRLQGIKAARGAHRRRQRWRKRGVAAVSLLDGKESDGGKSDRSHCLNEWEERGSRWRIEVWRGLDGDDATRGAGGSKWLDATYKRAHSLFEFSKIFQNRFKAQIQNSKCNPSRPPRI
jgi:hypothetical protein